MPTVVQDVSGDSALQTAIAALKAKIEGAEESSDIAQAVSQINTALADKQNTLTFDSTPTAGSTNPVTSGGIKREFDRIDEALDSYNEDITNLESLSNPVVLPFSNGGTDHYIIHSNGTVSRETLSDFSYTDYVDVSSYSIVFYKRSKHSISNPSVGMAFYDESKTYISGVQAAKNQSEKGYESQLYSVTVPTNAKYARFSYYQDTATYGFFEIQGESIFIEGVNKAVNALVLSKNLFDKSAATNGKFIQTNNGNLSDYAGSFVSDFIPIIPGQTYTYHVAANLYGTTAGARLFMFDRDKNKLTYATGTLSGNIVTVKIPNSSGAAYCRFTDYSNIIDSVMFIAGSEYPDEYDEYGVSTLDESFGLNSRQIQEAQTALSSGSLYNKKLAYNGDSIAESRLQSTSANNGGAYAKIIADITGGTYANSAVSGGILASAVPSGTMPHSVVNTISNMPDDADLICIEGGINDYWRDVPLGDYTESDYSGTLDTTTLCGALESIFRQATQKWVGKPICFVIVHKIKNTVYVSNSAGWTFAQGREKMIGICKKYAIPIYDAFAESGLNAYNDIQNTNFLTANSSGTPDGCHPNEAGYKKYYVPQLIALFEAIMPRS